MPLARTKVFKLAKGFSGRGKNCFRIARLRVTKALTHAYVSRKLKKRDVRSFWILRINAGTREYGVTYSAFMHSLAQENIRLNRKVLAHLAMHEPFSFKALVDQVKFMRGIPN